MKYCPAVNNLVKYESGFVLIGHFDPSLLFTCKFVASTRGRTLKVEIYRLRCKIKNSNISS